jgi:hypothetical protein
MDTSRHPQAAPPRPPERPERPPEPDIPPPDLPEIPIDQPDELPAFELPGDPSTPGPWDPPQAPDDNGPLVP